MRRVSSSSGKAKKKKKNAFEHAVVLVMSGTKKWAFLVPNHILLKHSLKPMMCYQGYQCTDLAD